LAQLTVRVNGRDYQIACDDGEEQHLLDLAGFVNRRVGDLVAQVGQVGEARLLLMAALLVADELAMLRREADGRQAGSSAAEAALVDGAERLESLLRQAEHVAATAGPA